MEIRGQDKDMAMSMGYGTLPQANQDSASKLFAASVATTINDRRRNEALDHHHPHHLKERQQLQQTNIAGGNLNPDPDPDPDPTIGGTSNSKQPLLPLMQPQPPPTLAASVRYRECLKNHAASMGGHVVDGCGEFMPGGEEGTPEGLKCAACDCHRNFHRREIEGESAAQSLPNSHYHHNPNWQNSHRATTQPVPPTLPPPPPHHHRYFSHCPIPPMMMAFGGASRAPAESSSEDLNMFHANAGTQPVGQPPFPQSKKRFRTKFTQGQKERMQDFAERLGWKIQKQEDQQVEQFCAEMGIKRQVFKVWMHNNKQTMKKKQL